MAKRNQRLLQVLLIGCLIPSSWLAFMGVHEFGHVVAASLSGGSVSKVVVHPLAISRTDVNPNPHPAMVVWGGPLLGVLLPLLLWGVLWAFRLPGDFLARFFAGFCLIANGAYIGAGAWEGIGDAGVMLQTGSPLWVLWIFGAASIAFGFLIWHGLGASFGLGPEAKQVSLTTTLLMLVLCVFVFAASVFLSPMN